MTNQGATVTMTLTLRKSLLLCSFIVCVGGTCTWTNNPDTIGDEGSREGQLGDPGATLEVCRSRCEAQSGCVAIDHQGIFCYWYSALPTTSVSSGATHSTCALAATTTTSTTTTSAMGTAATTTTSTTTTSAMGTAQCTMMEQANTAVTSSSDLSVELMTSSDCEVACKAVPQCLAYSFEVGTCEIHTSSDVTTSSNANYQHAAKTNCAGTSHACCFDTLRNETRGSASTTYTLTLTVDSCQALCISLSTCQGITMSGTTCQVFTSTPSTASQSGSSYFTKSCPAGADQGSLTIAQCGSAAMVHLSRPLTLILTVVLLIS